MRTCEVFNEGGLVAIGLVDEDRRRGILEVTDRVVVLRLGRVVHDAPTSSFTVDSLLGTITGLITEAVPTIE